MTTSIKQHFLMLLAGNAAFAFLPVSTTYAQEANNTVRLDTVVVQTGNGRSDEGVAPVNGFVPTATTTGSKDSVAIEKIPQSVSVVGRKQMDAIGAQKLDEALRYTPGVLGQPFGVDNDTDWLYIRGFEASQYGTYLDGLQNFSYGFGGFLIDSFGIERIDVLRGASSALYGGAKPGRLG